MSTEPMSTLDVLSRVSQMIEAVNRQNSANAKIKALQQFPDLKPFLKMLMDPLTTTGLTSKAMQKYLEKSTKPTKKAKTESSWQDLLEKLYTRQWSGNEAKCQVAQFIQQYPQHQSLILCMLDKDLKIRMGIKQLNKAFPGLITEFSVALAQDFAKHQSYFSDSVAQGISWCISRKYDGVRCIVVMKNGQVRTYSRQGTEFTSLQVLKDHLQPWANRQDGVLDGEICVVDEKGQEDFSASVSQIKRQKQSMQNFRYYVFDFLTVSEFEQGSSRRILSQRLKSLQEILNQQSSAVNHVVRMFHHAWYTEETMAWWQSQAEQNQWEGLMLRQDTTYKGTRSKDILKVKRFQTEDYVVQEVEFSPMRVIDAQSGLEKTETLLKSVSIRHKNHIVHVGSGFTQEQRRWYYQHPEQILQKKIAVQFFEETQSQDGGWSLRFPTVKHIYEEDS